MWLHAKGLPTLQPLAQVAEDRDITVVVQKLQLLVCRERASSQRENHRLEELQPSCGFD